MRASTRPGMPALSCTRRLSQTVPLAAGNVSTRLRSSGATSSSASNRFSSPPLDDSGMSNCAHSGLSMPMVPSGASWTTPTGTKYRNCSSASYSSSMVSTPRLLLRRALHEHVAHAGRRASQQPQLHLDGPHAQREHIVDGLVERGACLRCVLETLRHHEVVHAGRHQRKQGLAQHPLRRQAGRPRFEGVVLLHNGFGIEADDAEVEAVERFRRLGGEGGEKVGLVECVLCHGVNWRWQGRLGKRRHLISRKKSGCIIAYSLVAIKMLLPAYASSDPRLPHQRVVLAAALHAHEA